MTKTLPNIANPHIRIYREIGQQDLASIDDGWTHTHTHTQTDELYIYRFNLRFIQVLVLLNSGAWVFSLRSKVTLSYDIDDLSLIC